MPDSLITVFEDRKQRLEFTSTQMDDILSFQSIMGKDNISLGYDGTFQVMHYVGFISKGKTRLQILPKIFENNILDTEQEKREAVRVLINLLRISEFNKILELPEQASSATHSDIMELFISIFATKVLYVYSRQMNREYIDIIENSPFIKGKIEFAENIRLNPVRRERHVIKYQNYEHDNLINNVIKTVCFKLLMVTRNADNKKQLRKALAFLDDAQEIALSKELIGTAKFSRLNMQFKAVYEMAKMFFLSLVPESFCGEDTIFSFLVPLNELFEYYLFKIMDGIGGGFYARYQNSRAFAFDQAEKIMLNIRPDILLYDGNLLRYIVDAKYKNPHYENGRYTNISQSDIYQVFAYAKVYGVNTVSLIYPKFDEQQPPTVNIMLKDHNAEMVLTIACIDINSNNIEENRKFIKAALNINPE